LNPPFKTLLRAQSKELLIDEEVRRRKSVHLFCVCLPGPEAPVLLTRAIKMNLANEGLEARKKDEEVANRKRKAEDDKHWEGALWFFSTCRPTLIFVPSNR
jgi:DnaJ family protein C protein 8